MTLSTARSHPKLKFFKLSSISILIIAALTCSLPSPSFFFLGCAAESTASSSAAAPSSCDANDGTCTTQEEEAEEESGDYEDSPCEDKAEDCHIWAANGECATNPTYMITHCPVSCNSCMEGPIEDPCQNQHEDCAKWAADGECQNNPSYMLSNCARSCGTCPILDIKQLEEEEAECNDLNEMCGEWAERGECLVNVEYMSHACRDSCWICVNAKQSRARGDSEEIINRKRLFSKMKLGQTQKVEGSENEKAQTLSVVKSMHSYATQNMTMPDITDKMRQYCSNKFDSCSFWASNGNCASNPVFMMENCPLACLMCGSTEKFHRCAGRRDPRKKDAFEEEVEGGGKEGGGNTIDAMFEKIRSGDEFAKFGPEFLSFPGGEERLDDPWLVRFDTFLSDEEVDSLVQLGDSIGWTDSEVEEVEFGSGNPTGVSPRRISKSASCIGKDECDTNDVYQTILDRISSMTGTLLENFEPMEFEKFGYAESYGVHHDYRVHDSWKPVGPRVLSMYLCLSDVEEGGATGFPDLDWLFVKPKKGQALLWSNVMRSDPTVMDKIMVHESLPVVKGEKIGARVFIHLYDWKTQYERDCI